MGKENNHLLFCVNNYCNAIKHLQHDPAGDYVGPVERVSRDLQSSLVTPGPDFRQLTLWRHFNNVESEVNSSSVLVESVLVFRNIITSLLFDRYDQKRSRVW